MIKLMIFAMFILSCLVYVVPAQADQTRLCKPYGLATCEHGDKDGVTVPDNDKSDNHGGDFGGKKK
jgi:hypothetical protein